jgi:hypothetical protein
MANCRGCNAPIMWAITEEGKRAPLDPAPSTAGNVLVWRDRQIPSTPSAIVRPAGDGVDLHCATFAGDVLAALVAHGVPLRTNHFATCVVADRFRPAQMAIGGET